jgi:D-arabinose 1-dehydrogenase-like Zn-dependent alcohol dehydrogenase
MSRSSDLISANKLVPYDMAQKAIAVTAVGSPVKLIDRHIPEPGENELLIKVTATGCELSSSATSLLTAEGSFADKCHISEPS